MDERARIEIKTQTSQGALADLVTPGMNEHHLPDAVIEVVIRRRDEMADLAEEEARHTRTRDELGKWKRRAAELERSLAARDSITERATGDVRKANHKIATLETEVSLLREHGDAWARVGARIAEIITDPKLMAGPVAGPAREAIEAIRTALRSRSRPGTDALSMAEQVGDEPEADYFSRLREHLYARHHNKAARRLTGHEAVQQHRHEHTGPGTIWNHDPRDLSAGGHHQA
jgi:hypothetical protein